MRRGGRLLAPVGRRGLPVGRRPRPLRRLPGGTGPHAGPPARRGGAVVGPPRRGSDRLPAAVPPLSALVVQRRSGRYVFVLGGSRHPLLLLKPGRPGGAAGPRGRRPRRGRAAPASRPRRLPSVAGMSVRRACPGRPLWVLAPGRPGWSAGLRRGVRRPRSRARPGRRADGRPGRPRPGPLPRRGLGPASRRRAPPRSLGAARRDLRGLDAVSLQHRDLSRAELAGRRRRRSSGWWTGRPPHLGGVPGHDALQAAVALLEHGVALRRWSQDDVVRTFREAWHDEPLFVRARTWHRECVRAATGSERLADPLVVAFFARRLGRRISGGGPGDPVRGDPGRDARGRHRLSRALSRPSRPGRRSARHASSAIAAAMLGLRTARRRPR